MRTDGDSWDITTGVGSTALSVAAARALTSRRPQPLAVDPFAEVLVRGAGQQWADLIDGKAPDHLLIASSFGRAFQEYQAVRTKYFDDYVRAALDAGVRQMVIVAAGLDARAYRLDWPDGAVVYELDRRQVLEFKHQTLNANGAEPRVDRREVPVDLREDWPRALRDSGFDPAVPTAWLVEGLLFYVAADTVHQLFEKIMRGSAPGSRVAIEEMDPLPESVLAAFANPDEAFDDAMVQWVHLIYQDPRSEAARWFIEHGWHAERITISEYLGSLGRPPIPLGDDNSGLIPALVSLVTAMNPGIERLS